MTTREGFFSQNNEAMLQRVLYNDICRRTGSDLTEKQATRLMRTVEHYMQEVYRVQGTKASVQVLNKEVLTVVLPDYLQYMERQRRSSGRSVLSDMEEGPGEAAGPTGPVASIEDIQVRRQAMDVDSAFSQLQQQRQQTKAKPPSPPDFRQASLRDEAPVSMDLFERIKQDREDEARRTAAAQNASQAQMQNAQAQGQQNYAAATERFARERRRAEEEAEAAFAERERERLQVRAAAVGSLPEPPDLRALFMGDNAGPKTTLDRTFNRPEAPGTTAPPASAGNPAAAFPTIPRPVGGGLQQQLVVREPDVMPYKETELNLFVYSGDRDWISNSTETRYNFSVSFDPGNMPVGLHLSPTVTNKFKNITRIELVKAIMPGENLESFVTRSNASGTISYSSPYNFNILSFPYIQVRIPELDTNNYGTNQSLNAAFGVLQYDANWIYDTNNPDARGYFAMIPKFMKCQKTYTPTPLATLQKLSFQFQRPDSTVLSTVPDTLDILHIYSSKMIAAATNFAYAYDSAVDISGAGYYLLRTRNYFNDLTVAIGDRIVIKNLGWNATPAGDSQSQLGDFLSYIQQDGGLLVMNVGYGTAPASNGATANITLGPNNAGYCNYIIVRGKFVDPTTGSLLTASLGGRNDTSTPGTRQSNSLTEFIYTNDCATGRLLNASHQVQVGLRIIVREPDATGFLRPDNTF
jgi:hypothetical protein